MLHVFGNLGEKCCLEKGGYLERFYQKLINLSPNARAAALESDESMFVAHTSAEAEGQVGIEKDCVLRLANHK